MELQHIEIDNLKTTNINVRKIGAKDIADLVPSIKSLGILQPLLVRPKTPGADCKNPSCQDYEIVAGQRRYHALQKIAAEAEETGADGKAKIDPAHKWVPCIIMQEGDNAKAIEASLAENLARLPMDEIDQYKAFSALVKEGKSVEEIASQFGITERLVQQRLAIANLISPILTLYRNEDIHRETIRILTMATKRQQKAWLALYNSEDEYTPQGHALKSWLFGGADIRVTHALFDVTEYNGSIVSDLFGDESYFSDSEAFWQLQNIAIAEAKERYEANGWSDIILLDVGEHWPSWEHTKTAKKDGAKVFVQIANDGEVTFHEGFVTEKEAKRLAKAAKGETVEEKAERPELTKAMQNYLDLHRHSAVRTELLGHSGIALRLAVAQMIAGSELWQVQADPQKANTDAIKDSLATNKAEEMFSEERQRIRALLGMEDVAEDTLVYRKDDWGKSHDLHAIFAKLIELDDASVNTILTFVVAETLPAGSAMVEVLGNMLSVDMADHWQPDQTFFDLFRDKEAINACLKHIGGKRVADAHISSTAKVQKKIIADYLDGTREGGKQEAGSATARQGSKKATSGNWQPRYMAFPFGVYTKRGGIAAIDQWKAVKKFYAA